MPMAPHPDRLASSRDAGRDEEAAEPRVETGRVILQDPSGPTVVQLRQMYRVLQWDFNKKVLSMFEGICLTDEQWGRNRRLLLNAMGDLERAVTQQMSQIVGQKEKDKE